MERRVAWTRTVPLLFWYKLAQLSFAHIYKRNRVDRWLRGLLTPDGRPAEESRGPGKGQRQHESRADRRKPRSWAVMPGMLVTQAPSSGPESLDCGFRWPGTPCGCSTAVLSARFLNMVLFKATKELSKKDLSIRRGWKPPTVYWAINLSNHRSHRLQIIRKCRISGVRRLFSCT